MIANRMPIIQCPVAKAIIARTMKIVCGAVISAGRANAETEVAFRPIFQPSQLTLDALYPGNRRVDLNEGARPAVAEACHFAVVLGDAFVQPFQRISIQRFVSVSDEFLARHQLFHFAGRFVLRCLYYDTTGATRQPVFFFFRFAADAASSGELAARATAGCEAV